MKSKCCNKPLRLSRENPEPGETMYYICDGCNQPADPKCDHSDLIMCNECTDTFNDEYELTDEQLHADDPVDKNYPEAVPYFETQVEYQKCFEKRLAKARKEEREEVLREVEELLIEHFAGSGELFFPYVGVGASSKAEEKEFAKQVILDALGRERVYDRK